MPWLDRLLRVFFRESPSDIPCINPRLGRAFSITRPRWGGVDATPPGVSKLNAVALREKDQSIALDEYSRLVVNFLTLGQHLT